MNNPPLIISVIFLALSVASIVANEYHVMGLRRAILVLVEIACAVFWTVILILNMGVCNG